MKQLLADTQLIIYKLFLMTSQIRQIYFCIDHKFGWISAIYTRTCSVHDLLKVQWLINERKHKMKKFDQLRSDTRHLYCRAASVLVQSFHPSSTLIYSL